MSRQVSMTQRPEKTSYEEWMEAEGVPIIEAPCGIEDTRALERKPWPQFHLPPGAERERLHGDVRRRDSAARCAGA